MPRVLVQEYLGRRRSRVALHELLEAKKVFGVSVEALTHRCRDLGVFDSRTHRDLLRKYEELGWLQHPHGEPYSIPIDVEKPMLLQRLAVRAASEGTLAVSEVATLLGVNEAEIRASVADSR